MKKLIGANLSKSDISFNEKVSSDRIIVEAFFGRLGSLWAVMSQKWRWAEYNYDIIIRLCVGLTNLHTRFHRLRSSDITFYQSYETGLWISEKVKRANASKFRAATVTKAVVLWRFIFVPF